MTLEVLPCPQCGAGAKFASYLRNHQLVLSSREQCPVLRLEFRDFEVLVVLLLLHLSLLLLHGIHSHTPLDPSWLSFRSFYRPPLLDAWSRQRLLVYSLRVRGREPLRSASRLLGFTYNSLFWDPGHRFVAGPRHGPRCPQDPIRRLVPDSFLGRHRILDCPSDLVAEKFIPTTFPEGRNARRRHRCGGSGYGESTGAPLRRKSADTSVSDAGCVRVRTVKDTHFVVPLKNEPHPSETGPSWLPLLEGVGYVKWSSHASSSSYPGGVS